MQIVNGEYRVRTDDGGGLGNSTLDSAVQVQRFSTKLIPHKMVHEEGFEPPTFLWF